MILAEGGQSRTQSVKNGLAFIENGDSLVAIHDGVRPLVSKKIIDASYEKAEIHGSAIAATYLKESIRIQEGADSKSLDRSRMRLVQTPQTFKTGLIKAAYESCGDDTEFTDDASVAERHGLIIQLVEGSYRNIKITTPEDLIFAEAILSSKK
jgi:2-C-methyl-D-erythritol 4-phosphate cytidylyltransferase